MPTDDQATWTYVARETSGAFPAWSRAVENLPGPLAATADVVARSASASRDGQGLVGQAVMLRQLANTAKALHGAPVAVGEAARAADIAAAVQGQLQEVRDRLPSPDLG